MTFGVYGRRVYISVKMLIHVRVYQTNRQLLLKI